MSSSGNVTFMPSLIDPKPFGAFIEYTLKPILEEVREILELSDTKSLEKAFYSSIFLFIFDKLITSITTIIVTGVICWTLLRILSNSPYILQ